MFVLIFRRLGLLRTNWVIAESVRHKAEDISSIVYYAMAKVFRHFAKAESKLRHLKMKLRTFPSNFIICLHSFSGVWGYWDPTESKLRHLKMKLRLYFGLYLNIKRDFVIKSEPCLLTLCQFLTFLENVKFWQKSADTKVCASSVELIGAQISNR